MLALNPWAKCGFWPQQQGSSFFLARRAHTRASTEGITYKQKYLYLSILWLFSPRICVFLRFSLFRCLFLFYFVVCVGPSPCEK